MAIPSKEWLWFAVAVASLAQAPAVEGQVASQSYKGIYNGLIYPEDGVIPEHYGFFRIKVSRSGSFSGQIRVGHRHAELSGRFQLDDTATVNVKIYGPQDCPWDYNYGECLDMEPDKGQLIWTISFQLIDGREGISGRADFQRGTGWSATLSGVRAGYDRIANPAPQAGRYTFILPGSQDPQSAPSGNSCGSLKVDQSGNVLLTGVLANGSPITHNAAFAHSGAWPLYLPQRDGRGMVAGWLSFEGAPTNGPSGAVHWILPPRDTDFYPGGFYLPTSIAASPYQSRTAPLSNATAAAFIVDTGNASTTFTNLLTIGVRGSMVNVSSNALAIRFNPRTGGFAGTVRQPGGEQTLRFGGAALQNQNRAYGYFLGDHLAGAVTLLPVAE